MTGGNMDKCESANVFIIYGFKYFFSHSQVWHDFNSALYVRNQVYWKTRLLIVLSESMTCDVLIRSRVLRVVFRLTDVVWHHFIPGVSRTHCHRRYQYQTRQSVSVIRGTDFTSAILSFNIYFPVTGIVGSCVFFRFC